MVKWRDRMYMREIMEKTLSRIHRFFLYSDNFTIISNNCWGGIIYKYFGMKFQSGAEIFGGIILILIGLKVLLEGLGTI